MFSISLTSLSHITHPGSERASRTQNDGIRLKESASINSSLMCLGRCLEALRINTYHYNHNKLNKPNNNNDGDDNDNNDGDRLLNRSRHHQHHHQHVVVPYRDSKITHIFRDTLLGTLHYVTLRCIGVRMIIIIIIIIMLSLMLSSLSLTLTLSLLIQSLPFLIMIAL